MPGAWLLLALALSGCAASQTELPSLGKDQRKLLSKEERQRAITESEKKRDAEIANARKQIEQTR